MKRFTVSAAFVCVCAMAGGSALAAPLDGTFTLAGLAPVKVGTNYIDWGQTGPVFGTPVGDVMFTSADGSFTGLALTTGILQDLTNPPALVGVPISISNFLTATVQPSWNFTLNYISPGSGTAAGCVDGNPLTNCTPPGSPFTIVDDGTDAAVSLRMQGTVTDLVGPVSEWNAIFTTQFIGQSAASILATLASQGFVQSSHSSEWDVNAAPIPEPASMLLLGTGLTVLAGAARRKKRAA